MFSLLLLILTSSIANPIIDPNVEDEDGLNAHDWAVLGGNEFSRSLLIKVMDTEG